ncbi:hypothetical protein GCM10025867_14560 [Frondihabitans sucicola]|uniref:GHMP kinase N-terminal domain-containing protein n=1 Tax=Frondihabitans sucicola TaxID=1268041 RepID=A0ABM8GLE0_9MICO|nr:hypothetical protein GCM10025867_14560 [Frondihabitans sucicola]
MAGWSAYVFGIAWALGQKLPEVEGLTETSADLSRAFGLDIFVESDVPVGAGLSSSAAIECAVAVALSDLWSLDVTRPFLASVGQLAENKAVGAPTGIMDQSASSSGAPTPPSSSTVAASTPRSSTSASPGPISSSS